MPLLHYNFSCIIGDDALVFDLHYEFVIEHSDLGGRIFYPEEPRPNGFRPLELPVDFRDYGWQSKPIDENDLKELQSLLMSTRLPLRSPDIVDFYLGYICNHHLRIETGASTLKVEWHFHRSPFPWPQIARLGDFFEGLYCKYIEAAGRRTINGWRLDLPADSC